MVESTPIYIKLVHKKNEITLYSLFLYVLYIITYIIFREKIPQIAGFSILPIAIVSLVSKRRGVQLSIFNFPVHIILRLHFGDTFQTAFFSILIPLSLFLVVAVLLGIFVELNLRNYTNLEQLHKKIQENKRLQALLPICSKCKKIRDDKGYWNQLEQYLMEHEEIQFTHGLCPDCLFLLLLSFFFLSVFVFLTKKSPKLI